MKDYLKDFFELTLFENHAKRMLSVKGLANYRWWDVNMQPERFYNPHKNKGKGKNICPHYELLETAAEILMVKPEEFSVYENFCGKYVNTEDLKRPIIDRGHSLSGSDLDFAACDALSLIFGTIIGYLQAERPSGITINGTLSLEELKNAKTIIVEWERYKMGKEMLDMLTHTLFRVTPGIGDDKDEILRVVGNFYRSITGNCTGEFGFISPACEVAPGQSDLHLRRLSNPSDFTKSLVIKK